MQSQVPFFASWRSFVPLGCIFSGRIFWIDFDAIGHSVKQYPGCVTPSVALSRTRRLPDDPAVPVDDTGQNHNHVSTISAAHRIEMISCRTRSVFSHVCWCATGWPNAPLRCRTDERHQFQRVRRSPNGGKRRALGRQRQHGGCPDRLAAARRRVEKTLLVKSRPWCCSHWSPASMSRRRHSHGTSIRRPTRRPPRQPPTRWFVWRRCTRP